MYKLLKKMLCTVLMLSIIATQAGAVNWGLSYRNGLHKAPSGEESAESLAQYNAYYMGDPAKKVLYLTFDCGYENGNTPKILDTLKKHHVPGAFFVVDAFLDQAPNIVIRIANEGHIVGNHTANHPNMTRVSDYRFQNELNSVASKYKSLTGKNIDPFYRPPEGAYSHSNLSQAKSMGYNTILWSVAYQDWEPSAQPSYSSGLNTVRSRTHPGAIILLHAVSSTNAAILDELITRWKSEGYSFEALSALPGVANPTVSAIPNNAAFSVDGVSFSPTAYLINGSNYIKLRDFAKMLSGTKSGFSVEYDPVLRRANLESGKPYTATGFELKGMRDVAVSPARGNYGNVWLDGVKMEVNGYLIENENYLNLRQFAKYFDLEVGYDPKTAAVSLTTTANEETPSPDETDDTIDTENTETTENESDTSGQTIEK